jgi:adenylate cyclase
LKRRPTPQYTLKRLQNLIAQETGAAFHGEAEKRLKEILGDALGYPRGSQLSDDFSSREVTILLTDLRGFTAVSELYPVSVVLDLLNRYLVRMSDVVVRHEGTIDKFMGDSIMVLFGAPVSRPDDVARAVTCGVDMQIAMDDLNRSHKQIGMPDLFMGIGINTGTVMAGLIGSDVYSEYTVIGDEVNLASRIEAVSLRGQVLISERTFERCRDIVTVGETMEVYVKGKAESVMLREVIAIPSLGKEVPRQEMRRSPRVEVKIPFSYQILENNVVTPQHHQGTILDISYHGVLVNTPHELAPHCEVMLDLNLARIGQLAMRTYAKVLKTQGKVGQGHLSSLEFTSVSQENSAHIRRFIHLLLQDA